MSINATLSLADVTKLEGLAIDAYVLANSNLLLVKENADETKNIIQFNLKKQVLDKIGEVDSRLGVLTHLDIDGETLIQPEKNTICELVEENEKNIVQILETIGSAQITDENPNGSGMQGKINALEADTAVLKNTYFNKGRRIELINSRNTSTMAFTAGEIINCNLNAIPGLNISSKINEFAHYSYDLEISLLVKMDNNSLNAKINGKYAVINTIFNLNSIYFSNNDKVGIINLPFGDSIFIKFAIDLQTISFENVFMTNMTNYNREDIKVNNVVLHINEIESLVINPIE